MSASSSFRRVFVCVLILAQGASFAAAQANPFTGQWRASASDNGVVITLTIGEASSLLFPGLRQDGRSESLNLAVRNLMTSGQVATFTVDLPEGEGAVDFEFQTATTGTMGILRILRVAGEASNNFPTWSLDKSS
jgi:hypothetical protein